MVAFGNALRRAAAAGSAWTTSPMELRRTIRIRRWPRDCSADCGASEVVIETASRRPRREPGADDFAGGMILRIADDGNPAAVRTHRIGLRNAVDGVVGALRLDVGTDFGDESAHVALWEDDDSVDVGKCGEDFGSLFSRHQGAAFAFQCVNRFVGVDRDDQASTQLFRRVEVAYVADVKQIETSIGECDVVARLPPALHLPAKCWAVENLGFGGLVQGRA